MDGGALPGWAAGRPDGLQSFPDRALRSRPALSPPIPADNWGKKAIGRKTTGTGRMRHLKTVHRRFRNGFQEGERPWGRGIGWAGWTGLAGAGCPYERLAGWLAGWLGRRRQAGGGVRETEQQQQQQQQQQQRV